MTSMITFFAAALFILLQGRLLLLPRKPQERRTGDAVAEAAMLFLLGYSVAGSLLGIVGVYDHRWCLGLVLAWPVARTLASQERQWAFPGWPELSPRKLGLIVVAAFFLFCATDRFEITEMARDPGVYVNLGKNLRAVGSNVLTLPLENRLAVSDPRFAAHVRNLTTSLPGTYPINDGKDRIYQFLLGWPVLIAFGMNLFGPLSHSWILALLGLLSIYWFHGLVARWLDGWPLLLASLAFATNPLVMFFFKYPTSEGFLLTIVLYLAWSHSRDGSSAGRLLLAVAAIGLTHISTFLYLPILALYAVWAAIRGRADHLRRMGATGVVYGICLGLAFVQSEPYARDIFLFNFGERSGLPFWWFPALTTTCVLILSGAAFLLSVHNPIQRRFSVGSTMRIAHLGFQAVLVAAAALTLRSGYLLGWTRHYLEGSPLHGSWGRRLHYAGRGWEGLLHHNVVSIALGTGVVLFAVAFVAVFWPRRRRVESTVELFLLTGWSWLFLVYVSVRPDTPFNYYASRYFLPLLIPFIMLYALKSMGRWRPRWVVLALALVLPFNAAFTGVLVSEPPFQGRHSLIQQLEEQLPDRALVVGIGDRWLLQRFATNAMLYDLGADYAYLGEHRGTAERYLAKLTRLLAVRQVYVLTDQAAPGKSAVPIRISSRDNRYPVQVLYPLSSEEVEFEFFLYHLPVPGGFGLLEDRHLDQEELTWLSAPSPSAQNEGLEDAVVIELPDDLAARQLVLESGGIFLANHGAAMLQIELNGTVTETVEVDQAMEVIELANPMRIFRIEIRPETESGGIGSGEKAAAEPFDLVSLGFGVEP